MVANTWEGISSCAESVGAKFPELVASQWALESSWGKHVSGKNNFFGLKSIKSQASSSHLTQEFIDDQWLTITDGFIDFPSLEACIDYLVRLWYKDFEGYKGVNNAKDRNAAAHMLKEQGYATDPNYPAKLIRLMDQNAPKLQKIQLTNAAKYYNEENHQIAAWNWLQERLSAEELDEFAVLYRSGPSKPKLSNPLTVPYFSQRDNTSGTGYRECFSSSCAMVAAYYGKVKGDDEYNKLRARYGDTTNPNAQIETLRALGLKARFTTIMTEQMLRDEIKAGRPVPCGWLHYGSSASPSGGGHWSVVIGYNDNGYIFNDPYGEADVANGGYIGASGGNGIIYSRDNWVPRWRVKGSGGWSVLVSK